MGQVKIEITLRNAPDVVMARLGHLPPEQVHTYTTQGLIDTGATRSVLPPFVTERLGLIRLSRTEARYANGLLEEVDVTEPFLVEILGRETSDDAMVVGEDVLLGITILENSTCSSIVRVSVSSPTRHIQISPSFVSKWPEIPTRPCT